MAYKKIKLYLLLIPILMTAAVAKAGTVEIQWQDPDQYSDLGTDFYDDVNIKMFSNELNPYINRLAEDALPEDTTLQLLVTDVDLAGEFEPWRINNDVRIVRSIYPPKMSFTYKLFDAEDKVIAKGKETISDINFDFNIGRRFHYTDEFFYEKELIASWFRTQIGNIVELADSRKQ